jgi:hypothetical protein
MADGSTKLIENIQRSDWVAKDNSRSGAYQVARVLSTEHLANSELDFCCFDINSISDGVPNKPLLITQGHPIVYNSTRRAARLFGDLPGVFVLNKAIAADILPKESGDLYHLWDLQFETVGSYVANGVTIQSRNPRSYLTPMPKEFYFDQHLYVDKLSNDHDATNEFDLVYEKITH